MHALLHSVLHTLHQATTNPRLHWRLLDPHGQVWVSLLWSHCSFLLGSGAHKVFFVPSKSLFHQFFVNSGESMVGLKATSSKRAYARLRSAAPRDPAPAAVHCWLQRRHSDTVLSQSLWGLWVLVCTRFIWALWAFLAGMGFDSKWEFTHLMFYIRLILTTKKEPRADAEKIKKGKQTILQGKIINLQR